MNSTSFARFPMKKGEVIKLPKPKGYVIKADIGQLWITQSNLHEDVFVADGQSFSVHAEGVLVAEAMTDSFMSLAHAAAKPVKLPTTGLQLSLASAGAAS